MHETKKVILPYKSPKKIAIYDSKMATFKYSNIGIVCPDIHKNICIASRCAICKNALEQVCPVLQKEVDKNPGIIDELWNVEVRLIPIGRRKRNAKS